MGSSGQCCAPESSVGGASCSEPATETGTGPDERFFRVHVRSAATRGAGGSAGRSAPSAFTLVELLIVIAIVAVLLSLLLPGAAGTLRAGRGFKCQMALRSVAFDFTLFADESLHGDRGDDAALGSGRFRLETFQEAQYGIHEFWAWPEEQIKRFPDAGGMDPMRCPEVAGELVVRRNVPCSRGGVGPPENVSFGFNLRLHRAQQESERGIRAVPVVLTSLIVSEAMVPLVWDVHGAEAARREVSPVFSAPGLGSEIYEGDRYWFPGHRHNGAINVAFVDGHVEASRDPLNEEGWRWDFQTVR